MLADSGRDDLAVVVLAAGRGSRLDSGHGDRPKWFLPLRDGSVAELHLSALRNAARSWSRLLVVYGYRSELFDSDALSLLAEKPCELLFNPEYATRNNWFSLNLALKRLHEDGWAGSVCILNSDLVLPPPILGRFLREAGSVRDGLLAVDLQSPVGNESMKVVVDPNRGHVIDIGKNDLEGRAAGEYVGLSALGPRGRTLVGAILDRYDTDPARADEWYEAAFRAAMRDELSFAVFPIESEWVEVDDARDLEAARRLVRSLSS